MNSRLSILFLISLTHVFCVAQNNIVELAKKINNLDSAIYYLESNISETPSDTNSYVATVCYLAKLYNRQGQISKSEHSMSNLKKWLGVLPNNTAKGMWLNSQGSLASIKNDNAKALNYYLEATMCFEKAKDFPNLISASTDVSEFYRKLGSYDDARKYIKKGFDLYYSSKQTQIPILIRLYNRYAAIENENNKMDSSVYFSLMAIKLSRQINDSYAEAVSFNEIGYSLKNMKMVDSSFKCYQRAIDLWTKAGANQEAVHVKFNQARLLAHNNYPAKKIIPYYKEVIRKVEEEKINYWLDEVFNELATCYNTLGDSLNNMRYRLAAMNQIVLKERVFNNSEVNDIKEKYENEKNLLKISKIHSELHEAELNLIKQDRKNRIIYVSLIILIISIAVIAYLLKKINSANKVLLLKNKEKDSLIQEIHHRVKNNLQFVSSLINMQINASENSTEKTSLGEASRRIRSMAIVHEMLYNHDDLSGIEMNTYLSELSKSLSELVNASKSKVKFKVECDNLVFNVPNALALGMITSELVANSIKHAFININEPSIVISLKTISASKASLIIRDNGIGKLDEKGISTSKLGMRLIDIFCRQLKGVYAFKNENGLLFQLTFKY